MVLVTFWGFGEHEQLDDWRVAVIEGEPGLSGLPSIHREVDPDSLCYLVDELQ